MSRFAFAKVECLQNDFVVAFAREASRAWTPSRVRHLCDRREGIGADGLILLGPARGDRVGFRLFNRDGSRAEWSGNGVRGAAALLASMEPARREWRFMTAAGPVPVHVSSVARQRVRATLSGPSPTIGPLPRLRTASLARLVASSAVDVGNPHWVFVVCHLSFPWEEFGARCQRHPRAAATHGVNVEFVRVLDREWIEMRTFERGVGPTPASGTGALAAFAACRQHGLIDRTAHIAAPGGTQTARAAADGRTIALSAPARVVFTGVWSE